MYSKRDLLPCLYRYKFLICGTEEEYDSEGWGSKTCSLELNKFLPENKDVNYIMSSTKEKDQISFYWIPFERGKRKERKILLDIKL